jgi:hypothetical protein
METIENPIVFEKEISLEASINELEKLLDWMAYIFEDYSCPGGENMQSTCRNNGGDLRQYRTVRL